MTKDRDKGYWAIGECESISIDGESKNDAKRATVAGN